MVVVEFSTFKAEKGICSCSVAWSRQLLDSGILQQLNVNGSTARKPHDEFVTI